MAPIPLHRANAEAQLLREQLHQHAPLEAVSNEFPRARELRVESDQAVDSIETTGGVQIRFQLCSLLEGNSTLFRFQRILDSTIHLAMFAHWYYLRRVKRHFLTLVLSMLNNRLNHRY